MKVWTIGKFEEMEIGQKVLVARCGGGHSYFGEFGRLARTTSRHLVFETESGAQVKTAIDNINEVVGKAKKEGYWVSTKVEGREGDKNFIHSEVSFWDEKKRCLVKK